MSDAPERIWATVNGMRTSLPGGEAYRIGGWAEHEHATRAVLYVRADIAERENAELRAKVEVQRESKEYAQRCCVTAEARAEDLSRQLAERDAEVARMREALRDILDRLVYAFPAMTNYDPVKKARAALSGSRDGWRLVPVEPTDDMIYAAFGSASTEVAREIYRAMLAAAPGPAGGME